MQSSLKIMFLLVIFPFALMFCCAGEGINKTQKDQNWTHYVRTAGHGLNLDRIDDIIKSVQETNVFGIETDNDIPGRFESFLDPEKKLKAIEAIAKAAHEINNYAYVYIAGLECITANADQTEHTLFKDHPDWIQRKISGEPAVFGGGTAFWISKGDEDVWISPFAMEWKNIYMERVRQIAGTGIDGVYVDIPYWMTHFNGWEDSWASFDDYTVAAFQKETDLDAKTDLKLGDFNDPNFRRWVDFRIKTLTAFMKEIDENVKSVNPNCMTIAEIYPGYGESAVRVGADVYDMYPVVDVIAHEYSAGGYTAAERNPIDWFTYMVGMYTFRAFAEEKASWMLSYSWDGEENIDPGDAMKNLALAQVMAGTNFWDARGHVMSGSNNYSTRTEIFNWIEENEKKLYLQREPIDPVGVYFSNKSRDYFSDSFYAAYTGMMQLLLQAHIEFQIVTPRTLENFQGKVLMLTDAKCLSHEEVGLLEKHLRSGKGLIITAETGKYDEMGKEHPDNPILNLLNIKDLTQFHKKEGSFIYLPSCPGSEFYEISRRKYNTFAWEGSMGETEMNRLMTTIREYLEKVMRYTPSLKISASPFISAQPSMVNGKIHIFIANYKGLRKAEVAQQLPELDVEIIFPLAGNNKIYFLPYLGKVQEVKGEFRDGMVWCRLPKIERGAIVWIE